ncbi:MAG TPA: prepilin-type N-terminal cleavage/methylation domain-containing protein [Gemmatimonadaceae bacterium]|nr:prepilin-type N-terminal cleavage/methylation domain-containing protein [Gemmatimonadaceae bacterium]
MTRRGMTLVELLAALAVTALAASVGIATLRLLSDQRARLRDAGREVARAAAVRHTLVEWLAGAHAAMSPLSGAAPASFQLLELERRGRSVDELFFTTTAPTSVGAAETAVRLYVDDDARTAERGLVAELSAWPGAPVTRVELDSAVTDLDIRCRTDLTRDRAWTSSFLSTQVVPRGIELRLRAARGASIHPLLQLPIRVVVEGGR